MIYDIRYTIYDIRFTIYDLGVHGFALSVTDPAGT